MEALFEWLISLIEELWPFRQIEPWEKGVYIVNGKCRWVVGPGYAWPVIPWFWHLEPVSVVPAIVGTPLMSVDTADGVKVSFSVTVMIRVVDPVDALTKIDSYDETTQELVTSITAEAIGMMTADKVKDLRRTELARRLIPRVNKKVEDFGVECIDMWFTNLMVGSKTYRLLTDEALTGASW